MKILVGWNATEESRDALRLAVDLTHALDADLAVACVSEPGLTRTTIDETQDGWVERFAELFEAASEELEETRFVPHEKQGDPAECLRELAEEEEADLLVLGSSHRGRIGRVLFGSVAEAFLRTSPCPLAVAPRDYAGSPHAGIGAIALGYDGTREARQATKVAGNLARALGEEVDVVSIVPEYVSENLPMKPLEVLKAHVRGRADRGLAQLPREVRGGTHVEAGDAAAILERAGVEADLLVVGSRDHSRARRFAEHAVAPRLIVNAPCPVVVVPRGAGGQLVTR